MDPSGDDAPIAYGDVADALSVLRDVIDWTLTAGRWAEVDRSLAALAAALTAVDGGALRYETGVLELLGPVRDYSVLRDSGSIAVSVPGALRDRILAVIGILEGFAPVTIFLSDGTGHARVERAVEQLLGLAGLQVVSRGEPAEGSWFARMLAARRSPAANEALATVLHGADSRFVQQQDAQNTSMLMQNLAPLIAALQPTKDAAVRVGAVLVVKVDWVLVVHQLTARQQLTLDHSPELAAAPHEILHALGLHPAASRSAIPDNPAL